MTLETSTIENGDDYENERYFASPPSKRLIVKREGSSITRKIPKPVVLIDSREQNPFDFDRFPNWIASQKKKKLSGGDYSVEATAFIRLFLNALFVYAMKPRRAKRIAG